MRALLSLFPSRRSQARRAAELYVAIVAQARQEPFYADLGAPDTLDGRFDLIVLHASLFLKRLRAAGEEGKALAQATFDQMFTNLDDSLRELGVGDISVPKKIRKMVEAFYGRAAAYDHAIASGSDGELDEALTRNIYGGAAPGEAALAALRRYVRAIAESLDAASDEMLIKGAYVWPPAPKLNAD